MSIVTASASCPMCQIRSKVLHVEYIFDIHMLIFQQKNK